MPAVAGVRPGAGGEERHNAGETQRGRWRKSGMWTHAFTSISISISISHAPTSPTLSLHLHNAVKPFNGHSGMWSGHAAAPLLHLPYQPDTSSHIPYPPVLLSLSLSASHLSVSLSLVSLFSLFLSISFSLSLSPLTPLPPPPPSPSPGRTQSTYAALR